MDPRLSWESLEAAVADMRRRAEGRRFLKRDTQAPAPPGDVTIRLAGSDDLRDVGRVAQLDSSQSPAEPILVAEVEGTLIAALPPEGGRPVADPFRHTSEVVHLLELRAAQLNGDGHEPGRQTSPSGARPRAAER